MATLSYHKGDIFASTAQVIVNPVNCKGHMGKGLALAFKQRYPQGSVRTEITEKRTGPDRQAAFPFPGLVGQEMTLNDYLQYIQQEALAAPRRSSARGSRKVRQLSLWSERA